MNLSLVLNHRCNLRCRYCYAGAKVDRPMALGTARKAIDLALDHARSGYFILSLFGGEPLLELELAEAAVAYAEEQAARRGIRPYFSVSTNGTVLDERRLRLLTTKEFQVQVSLDGGPQAQDASRRYRNGRSSFAAVEANLKRLVEAGLKLNVLAVVDPANAHLLPDSLDRIAALGLQEVYFAPNVGGDWDAAACRRFEAGLHALADDLITRFREGRDLRVDPLSGKIVGHLMKGLRPATKCGFGTEEWAVSPSGDLFPCDRSVRPDGNDELRIGHVDSGLDVGRRDQLLARKAQVDPECAACELRLRCSHWCGCMQVETTGALGQVSPTFCWTERRLVAEADRIASTLWAEKNPAFLRRFYVPALHHQPGAEEPVRS
ncbi:MAG: radical SAM protein [Myxococcales bacterium]